MNQLALITASPSLPALITDAGEPAAVRFLEFIAVRIRRKIRCSGRSLDRLLHPLDFEIDGGGQVFDQQLGLDMRGAQTCRGAAAGHRGHADESSQELAIVSRLNPRAEFPRIRHGGNPHQ
jgi:hypothetical protein